MRVVKRRLRRHLRNGYRAAIVLRLFCSLSILLPAAAFAVPGPDSVVVVSNAALPESVALADAYADARHVPLRQRCALDLPDGPDFALAAFRADLLEPLRACLGDAETRIEAAVLVRGVPLRVTVPTDDGDRRISTAAALGLWRSEMRDTGEPVLGQPPGRVTRCGGQSCYSARWANPWDDGPFRAGWRRDTARVRWRPILVTMLNGRSYADAQRLVDSALASEGAGAGDGRVMLMRGADPARGVLDRDYATVAQGLVERGAAVEVVDFDANRTGDTLAAFFVGTATLGESIEGNDFVPGALVDNLTSLGAVPTNFTADGEQQVSIARWVARGVAGVHGATDEPLNNCFPSRQLLLDYVDGATLAEAFHRHLPFVHWRNLVLGDPMAAPYAMRPVVTIESTPAGLRVAAEDPLERRITSLTLFADGEPIADRAWRRLDHCLELEVGQTVRLLAVAEAVDVHPAKGWTAMDVAGPLTCLAPDATTSDAETPDGDPPDGALADATTDSSHAGMDALADALRIDVIVPDEGPDTADDGCQALPGPWFLLLLPFAARRRA